ncbi:GSCOCG00000849001-RA-CDS, partial [Cotesia congregata]
MKYKVIFFVFFKITLCCTISSASTDVNQPENPEFVKHLLIEGQKVDHDQNISLWSRNENSRLRSAIKIGKICLEDRDCKFNDNNELTCVFQNMNKKIGKCGCPERSKFNRNTLSCTIQRYKRNYPGCTDCHNDNEFFFNGECLAGIGAECPEGSECRAENSICERGTCQCLSGYKKINQSYCELDQCKENYDVCDPNLHFPCCGNEMQCINVNPELQKPLHKCVKQKNLGEPCENNLDCMFISNAKCAEDGTCICKKSALEYDNVCLNIFYFEILASKYESLFQFDVNTNSYNRMDDKIPQTDSSKKSNTIYGEWCFTDRNCQVGNYRDLVCHNFIKDSSMNFCTCPTGTNYDYVKKRCTVERHLEFINIKQQKHYESNHIQINGVWYSVYTGNCSANTDCEKLINGVCERTQCNCKKNWKVINKTLCEFPIAEIHTRCDLNKRSCTTRDDCFVPNSICKTPFCDCGEEEYYTNGQCISRKDGVGSSCICEKLCTGLKYGVCRNDTCECEENYEVKGKRCTGKHGQSCDDSDDCFANNAICRNKTCDCKDSFVPSGDDCVKGTITLGSKCSLEETCQTIKYSECKNGTCQCKEGYEELNNECRALIKKPCDVRGDCYAENADCIEKKCSCGNDYYYLEKNCHELKKALNDSCTRKEDCQKINNSECKKDMCLCKDGYEELNNECRALIGKPCDVPKDCYAENADCIEKKCSCGNDYYHLEKNCHELKKALNDSCTREEDCQKINNSECKGGKCQCLSNYKERDGICLGLEQAPCEIPKDCFAKNATCKNKKC